MKLYCKILGKECIREECAQWDSKRSGSNCNLYLTLGHFLWGNTSPVDWSMFIRYVEEIRPEELGD